MKAGLVELSDSQVVGLNARVIRDAKRKNPLSTATHAVRDRNGLNGYLAAIFQQLSPKGYAHLPLEKMAGLLLYRIAQGQFFLDGNKRTALLATVCFLHNNGHGVRIIKKEVSDLMWGFAPPISGPSKSPKYKEDDSIQFIFNNIFPKYLSS